MRERRPKMATQLEDGVFSSGGQLHRSRSGSMRLIALSVLIGVGILAALIAVTHSSFAQASTTSHESNKPDVPSAPASPNCAPGWTVIPSPNHAGAINNLFGISAVSANDIWAV